MASRTVRPSPAPRQGMAPTYLDHDLTVLTAVAKVAADNPGLPPLIMRQLTDAGLRAMPYVPLHPVAALAAWVQALPARIYLRHEPDPFGGGTTLSATCRLQGREVVLVVTTWWTTPDGFTAANGLITTAHLAQLVAWERDHSVRHVEAPAAPPVAGTAVDLVRGKM